MIKNLSLLFYYLIVNKLPSSFFPLGKFFNLLRTSTLRGFLKIGKGCLVEPYVNFGKGKDITIGNMCQINERVYIQSGIIGNYVLIAPNASILGKFHRYDNTNIPMALQGVTKDIPPVIEDDVWIGRNVVIMPGVVIGKGSIIGANAVVTKNIDSYSIVGGVPAKVIRKREKNEVLSFS